MNIWISLRNLFIYLLWNLSSLFKTVYLSIKLMLLSLLFNSSVSTNSTLYSFSPGLNPVSPMFFPLPVFQYCIFTGFSFWIFSLIRELIESCQPIHLIFHPTNKKSRRLRPSSFIHPDSSACVYIPFSSAALLRQADSKLLFLLLS